jgi:hypothetical protein
MNPKYRKYEAQIMMEVTVGRRQQPCNLVLEVGVCGSTSSAIPICSAMDGCYLQLFVVCDYESRAH